MTRATFQGRSARALWAIPALTAGALAWVACSPLNPGHSVAPWLGISALFLPLTFGLALLLRAGRRLHPALGAGAAILGGFVLLGFLRAQTDLVHFGSQPWRSLLILAVLVGAFAVLPLPRGRSSSRDLTAALALLGLLLAELWAAAALPRSLHWHLLGHQRFLGTAVVHLSGRLPSADPEALAPPGLEPLSAASEGAAAVDRADPGERPSVAFILVDTLRADAFTFYGGERREMPRVEDFARRSTYVTDVWANSTWTRPSMASFFTGRLPERLGVLDEDDRLPEAAETLAERFQARGYETAAFVTNPHVGARWGFAQGFDRYHELKGRDAYARAEEVRRRVMEWLNRRDGDAPLFLYVHFMDPHAPYLSGEEPLLGELDRAAYAAELRYLDGHLGAMLEALEERLGDGAVLVLTSDHGEELGEHGRFGHGQSVYPELTRIPAILRVPGAGPGALEVRVEARDLFGLLSAAGEGDRDLRSWGRRVGDQVRSVSSYKTPRSRLTWLWRPYDVIRVRGLQRGDRLIVWNEFGPTEEVYDLSEDPSAFHNLAPATASPGSIVARIDDAVGRWSAPEEGRIDAEELRELRALGYLQ